MEISHMKTTGMIATSVLSLLLGIAAPLYAQHEEQDNNRDRPEKEARHEQAKPTSQDAQQELHQPQHVQQQRQERNNQREQGQQQQQRAQQPQHAQQRRQDEDNRPERAQQPRQVRNDQRGNQEGRNPSETRGGQQSAWQQHRSQSWESDHRNWRQRGGYHGYRIPDDRFRGRFGPEHVFRINGLPFMVYRGYPRFQYGGYWITAVDPWPEYWGNDWYDNDDVYVAYVNDGYYLYNRRYPSIGIAIRISM
jgi:hypothetical protein